MDDVKYIIRKKVEELVMDPLDERLPNMVLSVDRVLGRVRELVVAPVYATINNETKMVINAATQED